MSKDQFISLRWLVYVKSSTVNEPIAAFQFLDQAGQWAKRNYPYNYNIEKADEEGE